MNHIASLIVGLSTLLLCNSSCSNKRQAENSNNETTMKFNDLNSFGRRYAAAWCSQKPDSVAAYFSENGSLTINKGTPSVGRAAISKSAESFMTAFPDMIVSMDSLITTDNGIEFHWTLTGTNTGPNGTGSKVKISGFERWQFDEKGIVKESIGSFDEAEYNRQLNVGVK